MPGSVKSKVAIVTGGTGYLGSVIARKLAGEDMNVYVPVRSLEKFKSVFENTFETDESDKLLRIYGLPCDAFNEDEVKTFCDNVFSREGRIDFLINTIGGYHLKTLVSDMDIDLINNQKILNFDTTFYFTKNALSFMKIRKFGRVISISAKPAIQTTSGKLAYSISKQAVINLMNTLAEENKDYDITFNSIVPDIIDTPANRKSMPDKNSENWVKTEDIAELCLYLTGDHAGKINGNVITMFSK
ncbi:MAG: SDR family oxidoreductase [Ignavibacteria bacterium]|nr:SDR family oxidoreductase [Ignavibacteria bacterium]